MSTRASREGFLNIRIPDMIIAGTSTDIWDWLEDTLGHPADGNYFWQDSIGGHFLHLRPEDMVVFKLTFKL